MFDYYFKELIKTSPVSIHNPNHKRNQIFNQIINCIHKSQENIQSLSKHQLYPKNKSQGKSNLLTKKTKQSTVLNYLKSSSLSLNHKRYSRIIQSK